MRNYPSSRRERILADPVIQDFYARLRAILKQGMKDQLLNVGELAKKAGVSETTVRNLTTDDPERRTVDPRHATLEWLAAAAYASITVAEGKSKPKRRRRRKPRSKTQKS